MPLINRCGGGGADVSGVTATASDVLSPKVIVGADGEPITGVLQKTSKTMVPGYYQEVITPSENKLYEYVKLNPYFIGCYCKCTYVDERTIKLTVDSPENIYGVDRINFAFPATRIAIVSKTSQNITDKSILCMWLENGSWWTGAAMLQNYGTENISSGDIEWDREDTDGNYFSSLILTIPDTWNGFFTDEVTYHALVNWDMVEIS